MIDSLLSHQQWLLLALLMSKLNDCGLLEEGTTVAQVESNGGISLPTQAPRDRDTAVTTVGPPNPNYNSISSLYY